MSRRIPVPQLTEGQWLNGAPLSTDAIHQGVTLIDFWTFGCVNCQRTIPHLRTLYERYSSAGLRMIGIHSPEFEQERDPAQVQEAIDSLGVTWPVMLDNDFKNWDAFGQKYWPTHYLVKDGIIVYKHMGEGGYTELEQHIKQALTPRT